MGSRSTSAARSVASSRRAWDANSARRVSRRTSKRRRSASRRDAPPPSAAKGQMLSSEFARGLIVVAHGMLHQHLRKLTLDEALFSGAGYRSILGVLKHTGGWAHVYRSYAFDERPKHWNATS